MSPLHIDPIRPTHAPLEVTPDTARLALSGIHHAYGNHAVVKDVSFAIAPGELVCLLGPSGCGKTTTLRIAAGLESPQQGTVRMGGQIVSGNGVFVPPERRAIGFLFQDYALFPHLDVLDNVMFGISGLAAAARRQRALEVLERVGMADRAHAWPHQLSGGQQQRVALARALAPSPRVMLLDEPFSGLDKRLRDEVRDATLHVLKESDIAALLVTHDPEEAMFMADRIALMRGGRIEQLGTPVDLYCHPQSAFAARFFGEVNALSGTVAGGAVTTPLGRVAVPTLVEGAVVDVLIRPEGLRLGSIVDGEDPAVWGSVLASRMLGRSSLVHLRVEGGQGGAPCHLHARVPGRFLPPDGELLSITLDPEQVFVYPRAESPELEAPVAAAS